MNLAPLRRAQRLGVAFKAAQRTIDHLDHTIAELARRYPRARLVIYQTCYNTGVAASAGTHDFDAVFDFWIIGLDGWMAQQFLRECGWAVWFRHTGQWASRDAWHLHAISLPPGLPARPTADQVQRAFDAIGLRVGEFVPGQVEDYFAHALGLKGQHRAGIDTSWFPSYINATVFKEDTVTPEDIDAIADKVVEKLLNASVPSTVSPNKVRKVKGILTSTETLAAKAAQS